MVALDFPPCQSAGVQRTLHFKKYVEKNGWHPLVLTSKPMIYDKLNVSELNSQAYFNDDIYRAFGLNAFKHLSFKGKHFEFTTLPDKFSTWYWDAVRVGRNIIKHHQPELIWTTFPCSTSVRIGLNLKRVSGLPWVADFRDPFSGTNPYVRTKNPIGKFIDEQCVRYADALVFTTKNAAKLYLEEYPFLDESKVFIIPNGYSEAAFQSLRVANTNAENGEGSEKITVLHSGFLYPGGRDISTLIDVLVQLKEDTPKVFNKLHFVFRGCTPGNDILSKLRLHSLVDKMVFLPTIPFSESIQEMSEADVLLVLQGEMFNNQIPGKVYEYIRAKRPMLALTHKSGATADLLREIPHACMADMKDEAEITSALLKLPNLTVSETFDPSGYNRDVGAGMLENVFQQVLNQAKG